NALAGRTGLRPRSSRPGAGARPVAARQPVQPAVGRARRNHATDQHRTRPLARAPAGRRPGGGRARLQSGFATTGTENHIGTTLGGRNRMSRHETRQAIALNYDGQNAPVLSAKGDDELAQAILAIAREYEVPIYENAELVRL